MPRINIAQTNFASGEIARDLLGRGDLRAYENGALKLRNVFISPSGGIKRRSGLRFIDNARGVGRLLTFEFNTEQVYLLLFTDIHCQVYRNGIPIAGFLTPWTASHLNRIYWTQNANTLLVVHPEVPPRKITRSSDTDWHVADWRFHEGAGRVQVPHYKFADDDVTLTPSNVSGSIGITASKAVFHQGHVGCRVRLANRELQITAVSGSGELSKTATALVKEVLLNTLPTVEWSEQVFSTVRGWPTTATFHQDRLIIGGSRDLPNRLWMSKSGKPFNFDLGEGLDDEAIDFAILSDQANAIRALFSGRHLQVFTSGAEWMVSGDPLTPTNMQLNRQTRIGMPLDRTVPPIDVDGATVFIARNGRQIREFLYTDVEQAYQAGDLGALSHHLIENPRDIEFDQSARLCHVIMASGTMATLTIYRAEQVGAWTLQETEGSFQAVASVGDQTYVLIERAGGFTLELLDSALSVDAGVTGWSMEARSVWSGVDHLEGRTVKVSADGTVHTDVKVVGGKIHLDRPANSVQCGLGYTLVVEPLPPAVQPATGGLQGKKLRPIAVTFRLLDTGPFHLDVGKGATEVSFERFGGAVLDDLAPRFSGDQTIRTLGWRVDGTKSLWRIEQSKPLPFNLLSVSTDISVNA